MPTMPLLETVKQNSAALTAPGGGANPLASQTGMQPTGGEQTQQTASLMGTAQTGKEVSAGTPLGQAKLSSLGERLANVNTLMSAQALQQAGTMQSAAQIQQAQAQQQQFAGQMKQLSQERIDQVESFNNQLQGMLQQSKEQIQSLTLQDDKSRVEQMGLMLRLGNEKYVDQLNSEATRARLDNAANFKSALDQSVFAQETDLLGSSLAFRNYLAADKRGAEEVLANMDMEFAVQIATADNKAASATTMWSGIGSIGGAAVAFGASALASPAPGEVNGTTTSQLGASTPELDAGNPELPAGSAESTTFGIPTSGAESAPVYNGPLR